MGNAAFGKGAGLVALLRDKWVEYAQADLQLHEDKIEVLSDFAKGVSSEVEKQANRASTPVLIMCISLSVTALSSAIVAVVKVLELLK